MENMEDVYTKHLLGECDSLFCPYCAEEEGTEDSCDTLFCPFSEDSEEI